MMNDEEKWRRMRKKGVDECEQEGWRSCLARVERWRLVSLQAFTFRTWLPTIHTHTHADKKEGVCVFFNLKANDGC